MRRLHGKNSVAPVRAVVEMVSGVGLAGQANMRNLWERKLAQQNQRVSGDGGISARWWSAAVANPRIHVGNHCAPEEADREGRFWSLSQKPSFPTRGRERAGEMLQACEVIDADVGANGGVALTSRGGMGQRSGTSPIFVGRIREKDLGNDLVELCAVEQAALLSGDRIALGLVGERKDVGGEEYRRGRLRISGGLGKTVVETPAASTGYVCKHTIESDAPIFVGIETLIKKIAQEAAILRDAFAKHTGRGRDRVGRVLHIRGEVTHGGETEPGNDRIGDPIDVLINQATQESSVQMDAPVARYQLTLDHPSELPLAPPHRPPPPPTPIPPPQDIAT